VEAHFERGPTAGEARGNRGDLDTARAHLLLADLNDRRVHAGRGDGWQRLAGYLDIALPRADGLTAQGPRLLRRVLALEGCEVHHRERQLQARELGPG